MPLARIITEFPEESVELAMQLRARGFQVETVSPSQVSEAPADLQVRLDECSAEDVLAHTAEASEKAGAIVFVAPGAMDEVRQARSDRGADAEAEAMPTWPRIRPAQGTDALLASSMAATGRVIESAEASRATIEPTTKVDTPPQLASQLFAYEEPEVEPLAISSNAEAALEQPQRPASEPVFASPVQDEHWVEPVAACSDREHTERQSAAIRGSDSRGENNRLQRRDTRFWQTAIVAAALAALVVTVGSVWQRRTPRPSALPMPQPSQQLPFQGQRRVATAPMSPTQTTPPSPSQATPAKDSSGGPALSTHSSPAPPDKVSTAAVPLPQAPVAGTAALPAAAVTRPAATRARAEVRKAPTKATHRSSAGLIAEDTVTYFDGKPRGKTPSKTGDPSAAQ